MNMQKSIMLAGKTSAPVVRPHNNCSAPLTGRFAPYASVTRSPHRQPMPVLAYSPGTKEAVTLVGGGGGSGNGTSGHATSPWDDESKALKNAAFFFGGAVLVLGLQWLHRYFASWTGQQPTDVVTPLERAAENFGKKGAERIGLAIEEHGDNHQRGLTTVGAGLCVGSICALIYVWARGAAGSGH